ncbi:MAG: oxygenase MpaB family protein [Acidobacteriota bacterium]|nr:oxygenase MpaB family protein [Acidobacteriota bacterium]
MRSGSVGEVGWYRRRGYTVGTLGVEDSAGPVVEADELNARLLSLTNAVRSPAEGLFGPDSELWNINRHTAMFLGSGRAALLQTAHPAVAQAIAHHSRVRVEPLGRFHRTFRQIFSMIWGDLDTALAASRRVYAVHTRINGRFDEKVGRYRPGDLYRARDREAVLWVHATLWETSILMYENFVGPLSPRRKEAYYAETRRFAALFGLDYDELPDTWSAFERYNRGMWESGELAVGEAGAEIASYLFRAPDPLLQPAFDRLRLLTAHLLPVPVREAFAMELSASDERRTERLVKRMRWLIPRLPARVRYLPPYHGARTRLGLARRHLLDRPLLRLYVGE